MCKFEEYSLFMSNDLKQKNATYQQAKHKVESIHLERGGEIL